jgi:hypothetical protein
MILTINDNTLITDIKDHFARCYPGLKIEFYKRHHRQPLRDSDQITGTISVGSIRNRGISGQYKIFSHYTVSKIEEDFRNVYGLNVQVFRNENNSWIQTTGTDHFTLAQQMEMSKQASKSIFPMTEQQLDEYDYL